MKHIKTAAITYTPVESSDVNQPITDDMRNPSSLNHHWVTPGEIKSSSLFRFLRAYLVQMRPYLLFISGVGGAAGMALAKPTATNMTDYIIAFFPFFFGYGFGQALTDCFQTDTDKLSAPYRPLSNGSLTIPQVKYVSLAGLFLSALIYIYYNTFTVPICLLVVFGLASYSFVKRRYTVIAPFYNAWVVGLLPLLGWLVISGTDDINDVPLEAWRICGLSFFSYANFVLVGYLKDISADRQTGYLTFPVRYGWNKTIMVASLIALCTLILFWTTAPAGFYSIFAGIVASLIIINGLIRAFTLHIKNEETALLSIVATVRSYIIFMLAVILDAHPGMITWSIIFYLVFEYVLHQRTSKFQV
jgi:4-hydroxybenzoate polyprenyltransferase